MRGKDAFCPKTGAPLSDEKHYDDRGHPNRAVLPNESSIDPQPSGELTNGAICSSKAALFNRFRRCHQQHNDANGALYRKTALSLRRLKRAASGYETWDVYIWYALQQRLAETGYDTKWMHSHAMLRCPHCHGQLKYERYDTGAIRARCGTHCTDDTDQLAEIRETIADLYSKAFDEPVTVEELIEF